MRIAAVREISPRFAECELTHLAREPMDLDLARRQHDGYTAALAALRLQILRLPPRGRASGRGIRGGYRARSR